MTIETLSSIEHVPAPAGTFGRAADVDIIVPVYRSVALTTRCLNSLAEHVHEIANHKPRLLIINDSPDDPAVSDMLESFASRCSNVIMLTNESNLGFVRTVNRGLTLSRRDGRDVILVNADTETFPDTLRNLVSVAYSDPQIGFVSPRSNNASFCSLPHFYGGVLADQRESHRRWSLLSRTLPAFHFTPTAVGFYLFIKHVVIANFGLLDSDFGVGYEEENDLILRANKVGYRAALANHSFAYHAGSASFTLLDMNLQGHKGANLKKMAQRHPEYLQLVRRYEDSAHYRAERLLGNALPLQSGQIKLLFDLSSVGPYFNGTNEMSIAIVEAFVARHTSTYEINVICSPEAFKFHKLDRHDCIRRHNVDLESREKFTIGIQLGQPFNIHAISVLEDLAVINVFGMLDTIAADCGHLSITYQLDALWSHVARHSNGLFFNSKFSEQLFDARFPDAQRLPKYARLLPTKLDSYKKKPTGLVAADHVLIMGNHFAHKASDATAEILGAAFPTVQFVVLGKENRVSRNVMAYRSGSLSQQQMESLYVRSSIVVLPSYVEGFGLGLLHALAAGKVVVARDIPATREILATYKAYNGVLLYADDGDLVQTLRSAMNEENSRVDDEGTDSWDEWADGFAEFCTSLLTRNDVFPRLVGRIQSGDSLRKAELLDSLQSSHRTRSPLTNGAAGANNAKSQQDVTEDEHGRKWSPVPRVDRLLRMEGEEFIYSAYVTILNRLPDADGLLNYLKELQTGISKVQIISRLRNSAEGRKRRMHLRGYRRELVRSRLVRLFGAQERGPTVG